MRWKDQYHFILIYSTQLRRNLLGEAVDFVKLVAPDELEENVRKILDF